jgi:hypothetical protein
MPAQFLSQLQQTPPSESRARVPSRRAGVVSFPRPFPDRIAVLPRILLFLPLRNEIGVSSPDPLCAAAVSSDPPNSVRQTCSICTASPMLEARALSHRNEEIRPMAKCRRKAFQRLRKRGNGETASTRIAPMVLEIASSPSTKMRELDAIDTGRRWKGDSPSLAEFLAKALRERRGPAGLVSALNQPFPYLGADAGWKVVPRINFSQHRSVSALPFRLIVCYRNAGTPPRMSRSTPYANGGVR